MRFIIKDYLNKIDISDITYFGIKNGITLSNDEALILLSYLKNNWEDILYGDPSPIISEIKSYFGNTKGEEIIKLFYFYKNKYKNYL